MATTGALPRLLTIDQLAQLLNVNALHVRRLVAERRVPFVKWRRFIRFDPTEIAAWLDAARPTVPLRSSFGSPRLTGHSRRLP